MLKGLLASSGFIILPSMGFAQQYWEVNKLRMDSLAENISSTVLSSDSLQSVFHLVVRTNVPPHYHEHHTENVLVLKGRGTMLLDGEIIHLKRGVLLNIPKGTVHAVSEVRSLRPLEVLSIQAPYFNGVDRIIITK